MIPIFSILCAFLSVTLFICFFKLYFSYKKTKLELIEKFFKIFLFLGLLYGFFALPRLLVNNLKIIELCLDLGFFFGFLAVAYLLSIPFILYYHRTPPRFLFFGIIGIGLILLIFNISNFEPAFIHFYNNFVFWSENRSMFINVFGGALFILSTMVGAFFFAQGGLKSEEKEVRLRAFLFSLAMVLTGFAVGVRFLFGFLFDIFSSTLAALLLSTISMLLIIIAIFGIKFKKEKYVKKII